MKVCLVTPKYPPNVQGGGEISVKLLAERLNLHPNIDEILVLSFDNDCEEKIDDVQVKRIATVSEFPLEISNAKVFAELLKHRKLLAEFDILHGYNVYYHPALGAVSEVISTPTVATLNSYAFFPKSSFNVTATGARKVYDTVFMPTTGRFLRRFVRQNDRFICLSNGSKTVFVENGFNERNIETIPNMIDPSFNVPKTSRSDRKIRVLYVGSVIERKGVEYLVTAAAHLSTEFEIRIVGDGNQRNELDNHASEIGVSDKVNFVGEVPYSELKYEYSKADVFVHPGIWPEPFGRTLLEAMQAALPIVATDIGGPADIISTEELLCPPADAAALADAIEYAAEQRDVIGVENKKRVSCKYDPDRICDSIINVYKEVIEENRDSTVTPQ